LSKGKSPDGRSPGLVTCWSCRASAALDKREEHRLRTKHGVRCRALDDVEAPLRRSRLADGEKPIAKADRTNHRRLEGVHAGTHSVEHKNVRVIGRRIGRSGRRPDCEGSTECACKREKFPPSPHARSPFVAAVTRSVSLFPAGRRFKVGGVLFACGPPIALHADLVMLARLSVALSRARAIPLAA
jgi:hypothetical protein